MFKPFENDKDASAIYDLTLENGTDRINMYGNLQITKDEAGLKTAKVLQEFVNEMVTALEKSQLPEKVEIADQKEVENPFL